MLLIVLFHRLTKPVYYKINQQYLSLKQKIMEKKNIPFISVPNILHVLVSKTVGCVLNAYLPILCGVCEDDWAQRGTVHLHGFCGIIPDESRNLFSGFVFVYHPPTFLFFFFGYGTLLRFLRADSLSVHRSTLICFFSLVFLFQLDFIFVLESFIIQFSHFSLVLLSSSSSLYHPPRAPPFILQLLILKL